MSMAIQSLPTLPIELSALIFKEFEPKDLVNVMKVCRAWKQMVESFSNLVIDTPFDLEINKNLSVANTLTIRASNISSASSICLSGRNVTLVGEKIYYLGRIKALTFDSYSDKSFIQGPFPEGHSRSLKAYSEIMDPGLNK